MSYKEFLKFIAQFAGHRKAEIEVEGNLITIEMRGQKNCWRLSSPVYISEGHLPDCLSYSGVLRWQERGAFLEVDRETESVNLVQDITSFATYLRFKPLFLDFSQLVTEWKDILDDYVHAEKSI